MIQFNILVPKSFWSAATRFTIAG